MKNAIEIDIHGLTCDNPECDYRDDDIKAEDYKMYIDKPCPRCGEPLLTKADYFNVRVLMILTKGLNKILPKRKDNEEVIEVSAKMNGTGEIDFNYKDEEVNNDGKY